MLGIAHELRGCCSKQHWASHLTSRVCFSKCSLAHLRRSVLHMRSTSPARRSVVHCGGGGLRSDTKIGRATQMVGGFGSTCTWPCFFYDDKFVARTGQRRSCHWIVPKLMRGGSAWRLVTRPGYAGTRLAAPTPRRRACCRRNCSWIWSRRRPTCSRRIADASDARGSQRCGCTHPLGGICRRIGSKSPSCRKSSKGAMAIRLIRIRTSLSGAVATSTSGAPCENAPSGLASQRLRVRLGADLSLGAALAPLIARDVVDVGS